MYRHKHGFTLLEILVSLAILSILFLTAAKHSGTLIDNSAQLRNSTLAHWVAMNKAAELRLPKLSLTNSSTTGNVVFAGTEWFWRVVVLPTPEAGFNKAQIEVALASDQERLFETLIVYLGKGGGK